ncbi:hypothetical protein D3C80_1652360 [compost metagenome]
MIHTPDVRDGPVGAPPRQISRSVHLPAWLERIIHELLRRQCLVVHVSARQSVPANAQLACYAYRLKVSMMVHDVRRRVRNWPADWQFLLNWLSHRIGRCVYGALGWAVYVNDLACSQLFHCLPDMGKRSVLTSE